MKTTTTLFRSLAARLRAALARDRVSRAWLRDHRRAEADVSAHFVGATSRWPWPAPPKRDADRVVR